MNLVRIYECLCDETRLRILNLLMGGPLCVCHLQQALDLPQVKISKHLAYLRKRNILRAQRQENWMIYALPSRRSHELEVNLKCLQDCASDSRIFFEDKKRLKATLSEGEAPNAVCCPRNLSPRKLLK